MDHPTFSVIVPTYGRAAQLTTCLRALAHLDYPRDRFEVIVVDDGSDPPAELPLPESYGSLRLSLLRVPHAGPGAARNIGAAHARGRFLAFVDDDCACAPDWLGTLATRFAAAPDHAIGGQTLNALPANLYAAASQLLHAYIYSYYNADPSAARFFASNNFGVPSASFRAIGGFNATFGTVPSEDREFCDRWRRHGYRMTYAPEVIVYHARALTFRGFWKQHFGYGCGAFYFHTLRAHISGERFKLEPGSFYLNLLRRPLAGGHGRRATILTALLALTQIANAAGFFWTKVRARRDLLTR
jgi:glycosyltransferase involved in cell wall biosynthesis